MYAIGVRPLVINMDDQAIMLVLVPGASPVSARVLLVIIVVSRDIYQEIVQRPSQQLQGPARLPPTSHQRPELLT